ncbi:MAG: 2-C-methyl-D-erythritol 4-phosphate cytidylyltransferase [Oscillospiraceae bacterium]|nr:2-C-methyl-D-erythritol 4-phosphate cytidylyltransferase [Oscillospiraceae bacterium]
MNIKRLFKKEEKAPRCSAVIVAAGSAQRMGSDKINAALGGIPVLVRTLRAFQESELVDEIIVVTRMDKIQHTAELCKKYGIEKASRVVCGGSTRAESALAGVSEVRRGTRLIAIHDGARPLVTQAVISRTVRAAAEHFSAVPVVKSTDTLKIVDDKGMILSGADRESTVRVQTPQVFDADLIKGALTRAVTEKLPFTDDCSAMELMGIKTYTVPGDEDNIKLTTPRDRVLAEAILKDRGDDC